MIIAMILSSLALLAATATAGFVLRERKRSQERNTALMQYIDTAVKGIETRVSELEKGTVPDYEKAKEAAKAVNDFNSGITGILGFDPYEALKQQREKERGGEQI